ncbi:MAG: PQQ-binding-like beta-propeller repeat protein, partial [Bacteroidota bacterium]
SKNPKQVFIVDKESGKEIFKAYDAHMGSSIGLMGDRVMVSRFDGTVICTDVQDAKKAYWSLDVGESAGLDPPLYLDNKLYIPSWSAHLYCVDKESGKTLWAYERDDIKQGCGTGFEFQPIPYKDQLLFTHSVEGVFALDRESGRELKNIRLSSGVNQGLMYQDRYLVISSYEYLHIYDAEKMELIKQVKLPFRAVYAVKLDGSKMIIGNPDDAVVRNINRYFEGKLQGENRILVYDLEKLIYS